MMRNVIVCLLLSALCGACEMHIGSNSCAPKVHIVRDDDRPSAMNVDCPMGTRVRMEAVGDGHTRRSAIVCDCPAETPSSSDAGAADAPSSRKGWR